MNFETAVEDAVAEAKARNFNQSIDMIINLGKIDLSNPNNRVNEGLKLPYQADEDVKIAVIGDTLVNNGGDAADLTITENELEDLFENPDEAKDIAEEYDFLIAEAPLMPDIGQHLGQVLGPRDMMPDPMPPGSNPTEKIEGLRSTISVRLKEEPLIQLKIGNEEQDASNVARNAQTVYNFLVEQLPEGENNLKNILLKTTMGPTVEVQN
ncbi:50S ribosomal protein L1 [Candidatus Nanohalococcus occultus]|uniref:50S ribosomal protein L1 n=1 Tax=Candidatus Nanohalococcus occultus TaxID=2978047 RepID=A0ABY8CD42_9ARCH|nr:Ribosomal protein L1 [Candidatus Nanohaloarchaeota archaeon SVXNc]